MKYKSYKNLNCSVAQALDAVGERWALLILREAFYGATRFNQFANTLGIAKNILSARLSHLVEQGLLQKRPAQETNHTEYVLTDAGRALRTVIVALIQWGDEFRPNPDGTRLFIVEEKTGKPIQKLKIRNEDGNVLGPGELGVRPGPAADKRHRG